MIIFARQTGDYFQFVCEDCNENLKWNYIGRDPSVPTFEFTCPKCKSKNISKNDNFNDNNLLLKK